MFTLYLNFIGLLITILFEIGYKKEGSRTGSERNNYHLRECSWTVRSWRIRFPPG